MKDKLKELNGKHYIKCDVVMLTTDKEDRTQSHIYKFISREVNFFDTRKYGELILTASPDKGKYECQHLYILSLEEIKDGDWYILLMDNDKHELHQFGKNDKSGIRFGDVNSWTKSCKKIIATTNPILSQQDDEYLKVKNLPQPSPEFIKAYIEAYNKGEKIKKVLVEYIEYADEELYKIKELKLNSSNEITIKKVKACWTREEVVNLCKEALCYGYNRLPRNLTPKAGMDKWIEENL